MNFISRGQWVRLGVFLHPVLAHEGLIYAIDNIHTRGKKKKTNRVTLKPYEV